MKADEDEQHLSSPLQAWVRALSATASIGVQGPASLPELIEQLGERFDTAPALLSAHCTYNYRQLADAVRRYARWGRAQGLTAGDVVGLLMHNSPQYLALWLGLTRIGVTVALLNTQLRPTALAHCIAVVQARGIIVGPGLGAVALETRPLAASLRWWSHGEEQLSWSRADLAAAAESCAPLTGDAGPSPSPQQRALYIYTSGTTGLPKAANISHRRVMQWAHWFAGMLGVQSADRMYDCLPMYHSIGGVVATGAALVAGASVVVRERFSAHDFWDDVIEQRCTLFQYIGELCRYLLALPLQARETQHSLRLCCGNGLRREVWLGFQERFRIPQILEYYAATEANFSLYNCEGRVGAIGRIPPFLSHRMRVALIRSDADSAQVWREPSGHCQRVATGEVGEAICEIAGAEAGAGQFEGYSDPRASEQKTLHDVFQPGDTWYRSGDLMRQDERGFFYFVDRIGDTFRWKGENVSTTEVTASLQGCTHVREAVVFGVPVPGNEGRAGMAALVVDAGFDLAGFQQQLAATLPAYAQPLFLRLVPELELTGTFKLNKQRLSAEGYDATQLSDPLYMAEPATRSYVPLDAARYGELLAGTLRV
ncbi:MAG TPA: long-chain-acyl-CoA synthetase [Steroidobacteraceae bacterium]|jgi:fatty-acyl-CoA synthase|nr:long-chain-acyl-CoA synthetase [Steroidobacteraceae bacterium]